MAEGLFTKRATRLMEIAGFLAVRHRLTTGSQIAESFEVSVRTVYRDIEDIRVMGLDVMGEAGTGYLVTQAQFIEWFLSKTLHNQAARLQAVEPNYAERLRAAAMVIPEVIS